MKKNIKLVLSCLCFRCCILVLPFNKNIEPPKTGIEANNYQYISSIGLILSGLVLLVNKKKKINQKKTALFSSFFNFVNFISNIFKI